MKNFLIISAVLLGTFSYGQVKFGDNPSAVGVSSALELESTNKALVITRVASTTSITNPVNGMLVYDISSNCVKFYQNNAWTKCLSPRESSGGTAVVNSYSCSIASTGTMALGIPVSGVTQTISANVTTIGSYSISAVANGVTFAASGTFTTTGNQNIVLTATGTPTAAGSNNFVLNTNPGCSFTRNTNEGTITLVQNHAYLIASVFDLDYLPYVAPTGAATTMAAAADGTNDAVAVNIQGTITAAGITVKIPVASVTGSGVMLAHSTIVNVPAALTEDNIARSIQLSWPDTNFDTNTRHIDATLIAIGGVLNIKKLDINNGIGNDALGVILGQFTYPYNTAGQTTTFSVRAVALVPDRMFNVTDNTGTNTLHRMFYQPVVAEDGTVWLNNNLGAHYANASHPDFNPVRQAASLGDFLASGSLFQWGRSPDGHELVTHTGTYEATALHGTTATLNNAPTNALFITTTGTEWRTSVDNTLWSDGSSANQPCPRGFRVPSRTQQQSWANGAKITNNASAFNSILKYSGNRTRNQSDGALGGGLTVYQHSSGSVDTSVTRNMYIDPSSSSPSYFFGSKAFGIAVRCIRN